MDWIFYTIRFRYAMLAVPAPASLPLLPTRYASIAIAGAHCCANCGACFRVALLLVTPQGVGLRIIAANDASRGAAA